MVGSNISHKLRLSSVRPSDEGTYECRVINFSESRVQRHRVQAYLQVHPDLQEQQGPVHNRDQKKEEEEKTSEQNAGPEDHQMREEEQRTQHVAHQFHEEDHHQLHEGNKTRTGKKHQSESRDLKTE